MVVLILIGFVCAYMEAIYKSIKCPHGDMKRFPTHVFFSTFIERNDIFQSSVIILNLENLAFSTVEHVR